MSKQCAYKNLEIYDVSRRLAIACYGLTYDLPKEEKTNFSRYIRAAALTVHVNIAQGAFSSSKKRRKYIRAAQDALIIIDAATEILIEVGFVSQEDADIVKHLSSSCFQLLDAM